jgi:murein DD-endopeptidase MepM/ murein hydrolase activator NlpD
MCCGLMTMRNKNKTFNAEAQRQSGVEKNHQILCFSVPLYLCVKNLLAILVCITLLSVSPWSLLAQEAVAPAGLTIHVVQRGENLFRIGLNYGMSVDEIAQLNGILDPTNIQVGQRLLVPATPGAAPVNVHIVQAGETLDSIARLFSVDVTALGTANGITDPNAVYVGLALVIPSAPAPVPAVDAGGAPPPSEGIPIGGESVFHVILTGETMFQIATQYGVTVNAIAEANGITDPSLIYPGQQILIPGVKPPQLALDLPPTVSTVGVQPQVFVTGRTGMVRLQTPAPSTVSGAFMGLPLVDGTDGGALTHTLLFGIPIGSLPGIYPIELLVTPADGTIAPTPVVINVQVLDGGYGTEAITVPEDQMRLLGAEVDASEGEFIRTTMGGHTPERLFVGPMGLPAAAAITSPFGSTRSYNGGVLQRLHSGTDFAGAPGTPIYAPAAGVVVFSGMLDVRGLATIVDHGWGVYTGYWHQTESYVTPGSVISAEQVIGTIGSSGRVTGPHLHWELWVNGVPVDPMQWVQQSFSP